jgi:hypothetical protein
MSESNFQIPVVSGSGDYFSWIGVDAPRSDQVMVLDRAYDVTWIQ